MSFDPDEYLRTQGFDPDEYLKQKGYLADKAARAGLDVTRAGGETLGGVASASDLLTHQQENHFGGLLNRFQKYLIKKTTGEDVSDEDVAAMRRADTIAGPARALGSLVEEAGRETYQPDPTRGTELGSRVVDAAAPILPAIASGPYAVPQMALQMGEGARRDAEAHGAPEGQQDAAFAGNAALAAVAGKALGVPAKLIGAQAQPIVDNLVKTIGAKVAPALVQLAEKAGETAAGRVLSATAGAAARGAVDTAAIQTGGNVLAKDVIGYDPKRERLAGVPEAATMGAIGAASTAAAFHGAGEIDRARLDTGKNVPESPKTLDAQQEQLTQGRRPAQMFPLGTDELALPEGMQRVETDRGIFHFNPDLTTADQIQKLSSEGRENEVLNLGPDSKPDVDARAAATGERRMAVTERKPDGTEVRTAVATAGTAGDIVADFEKTKTPGNAIHLETVADAVASRPSGQNFVADLMAQDAERTKADAEAATREKTARAARQEELAGRRASFDDRVRVARETFADPAATFAQINGALESMKFYAEDNSVGLNQDQRQTAARAQSALAKRVETMRPAEEARQATDTQRRLDVAAKQLAEQRTARAAGKQDFKAEVAAGKSATGGLDYATLPDERLAELANHGDKQAEQTLMRRGDMPGQQGENLLDVLTKVKLPGESATLPEELKTLIREEMTPAQRMRMVKSGPGELDNVATRLREDHGFSWIQTPADVIDAVQRALRGEDVRADWAGGKVNEGGATVDNPADLAQKYVSENGTPEPKIIEAEHHVGKVLRTAQDEQLDLFNYPVPGAETAATGRHGPGLPTGENAPADGLTARERAAGALTQPTSPEKLAAAFKDSDRISSIVRELVRDPHKSWDIRGAVIKSAKDFASLVQVLRTPYVETVKLAFVNAKREVVHCEIVTLGSIRSALIDPSHIAQALTRAPDGGRGLGLIISHNHPSGDPTPSAADVYVTRALERAAKQAGVPLIDHVITNGETYYSFNESGQIGAPSGKIDSTVAPAEKGHESTLAAKMNEPAPWETVGRNALRFVRDSRFAGSVMQTLRQVNPNAAHVLYLNVKARLVAIERVQPNETVEGWKTRIFRAAGEEGATAFMVDAPANMPEPGARNLLKELSLFGDQASLQLIDFSSSSWLGDGTAKTEGFMEDGKTPKESEAEKIATEAPRVEGLPAFDRRAALQGELQRGRELAREGNATGNDAALSEGTRLTKLARERLDDEFPGWEKQGQTTDEGLRPAEDSRAHPGPATGGDEPPREPPSTSEGATAGDSEPSPFSGGEADTMPVRPGKFHEVYGQTAYEPGPLTRMWNTLRKEFRGIRGAIPELPTFPEAAWNKTDSFIKEHGPQFYNRLKEFYRVLKGGNDYVQRTAEQQVARVIEPLIKAGGKFEANDYARLQQRQEQVRRLRAENKPIPRGVRAEIAALNSKLEESPYVLFNRLVLALDLNWRQQHLKDSEGNPIHLPAGVNAAELKAELQRLGERIAAGPHAKIIRAALDEHMALVKRTSEDLKARGLLAADHLANPFYFPHVTLEVTKGNKIEQRELRPAHVSPGTDAEIRTYLIEPVGSTKPISTDYLRSMYYHQVQVGAHNFRADAVRDYARPYDIRTTIEGRAKQLSKQRGVPVSWQQTFHEEFEPKGYVLYGTDSRDAYPEITVNRDALARRLGVMLTSEDLHRQLAGLGLKGVKLLPEDLQETLNTSAREVWAVPSRVADALRAISDRQENTTGAVGAAARWTLGAWKQWKLFMPQSHIRYEFGNIVPDLEKIVSATPRTLKFLPRAAKEVREFWLGGEVGPDLQAALKESVLNTVTAQEMRALERLPQFRAFETTANKLWAEAKAWLSAPAANATRIFGHGALGRVTSIEESMYREAVFRYANFLNNIEKIRAGARPDYAGAYWKDIDAMTDSRKGAGDKAVRQAAQISKSTFGDYGDLSVAGKQVRDKLAPFYSWQEINFKYHANLLRNLRDMVRAGEMSRTKATAQAAQAIGTAAAGFTARAAGAVALRLALPYVAVYLWNNSQDREDLEKLLSEEDRRRFHIILGEQKDGNTTLRDGRKIEVLYAPTAFQDVAKWFSGPKFAQAMSGWLGGKTDFPTAFSSWRDQIVPDFFNNVAQGVGPFLKIPYTIISKKSVFPDVTDQRTVPSYDMRRVIIGEVTDQFTADQIERIVNKDYYGTRDLGSWAKQLILQVRERDPEQWAFYEMRDKAQQYREQMTGSKGESGGSESPTLQLVRNFRRAIYRGDVENATRFYLRLLDQGYTAEKFAASIRSQDPLSDLPKESGLRKQFVRSLSDFDREQLQRAYAFFERINASRGRERVLFPTEASGPRGIQRFEAQPRTGALDAIMQRTGAISDDQLKARVDRDLRQSLIHR